MAGTPGRSGRKPKPVERKIAAGNPGKRKLNLAAPQFGTVDNADPPADLQGEARDTWLYLIGLLGAQKTVHATDLLALTRICAQHEVFMDGYRRFKERGSTYENSRGDLVKNPAITVMKDANSMLTSTGGSFGLDPASRQRLFGLQRIDAGDELKTILEM